MEYFKYRHEIKLVNRNGDILRWNVFTCMPHKNSIIKVWRKLYGKKFEELIIIETLTPKT